jgi:hypothetical protein
MLKLREKEIIKMINKEELKENQVLFERIRKNPEEESLKLKEEWNNFLNKFSENNLKNLTKEDYVVGLNNHDTFCYWIEQRLSSLGNMLGATASKFGIYYSEKNGKYEITDRFGETPEEAFSNIKGEIINLLIAGRNGDIDKMKSNLLSPMLKGKILFLYYPEKFLNILSKNHLIYFLNELEIPFNENTDEIDKRNILMNFKNSNEIMKFWTNQDFARFLYKFYRPPKELGFIWNPKDKEDIKEQNEISQTIKDDSRETKLGYLRSVQTSSDEVITIKSKGYKRDNLAIQIIKDLRGCKCQICGVSIIKKDGSLYAEASHITAKRKKGYEMPDNIMILCPNHHKEFDFGDKTIIARNPNELIFKLNGKEYKVNLGV